MRTPIVLSICVLLFGITSCSDSKVPKSVMDIEQMQAVYWDYIRADVYANELVRSDTNRNAVKENARLQEDIFLLYKLSKEEFYESYDYYLNHPTLMKEMLDTMAVRQQSKIDIANKKKASQDSLAVLKQNRKEIEKNKDAVRDSTKPILLKKKKDTIAP